MINPNKIEEMARTIQAALPPGLKSVGEEVDKKVKQVIQAQLMKLDLVSREEFDVQTKVLLRTREKLQALEDKLQQLEKQLAESRQEGSKGESLPAIVAELEKTTAEAAAAGAAATEIQLIQPELEKMAIAEKLQVQQVQNAAESYQQVSGQYQAALAVERERENVLPEDCRDSKKLLAAQQTSRQWQKNLYEALETARRQKQQADQDLAAAMAAEKAAVQAFKQAQARLGLSQGDFEQRCQAAGFIELADYQLAAAWSDEKREELKNRIRAFDDRLAAATEGNRKMAAAIERTSFIGNIYRVAPLARK